MKKGVGKNGGNGVMLRGGNPNPIDAEDLPAAQPNRPRRPQKLKLDRRGSPSRERSRRRVRSVLKKSVDSRIALIKLTKMAEIYKVATLNINGMSAGGEWEC